MNPLVNNNMISTIMQLKNMLAGKDPNLIMQNMMRQNPKFAQFVRDNQGKTPEQVAQEYGLNMNEIQQLFK